MSISCITTSTDTNNVLDRIPASILILIAILAIQVGAGVAKQLFPILTPEGTAATRIIFTGLILCITARKPLTALLSVFTKHWMLLIGFGLCIAAMNLFFYLAISRIPLGAAVAFEFLGPLTVATFTSRHWTQFLWIALAGLGVLLLSPFSGADLNTLGILFALLSGTGWACFILLAERVGTKIPGNDGLTIGMLVAGIVMLPLAVSVVPILIARPEILLACILVSVLSTTIPFTLEFQALKRMPKSTYGILVSAEPAVATLIGAIMLNEHLGLQGMVAISCVVIAAIGISISDNKAHKKTKLVPNR